MVGGADAAIPSRPLSALAGLDVEQGAATAQWFDDMGQLGDLQARARAAPLRAAAPSAPRRGPRTGPA